MAKKRDYAREFEQRVEYIRSVLASSGCKGIVYGNSGGKDCTLVSILCKAACDNTVGIIMPCESSVNFLQDKDDALKVAEQFGIEQMVIDVTDMKLDLVKRAGEAQQLSDAAIANIAPRLRMTALYLIAQSRSSLVAGTGNLCERYMGYFTKWGDGACDFNPIADLSVSEIYAFLRYLKAPASIIAKAPSAGLFEGQTDEAEMGVTYTDIEAYIAGKPVDERAAAIIERTHRITEHKRLLPGVYENNS